MDKKGEGEYLREYVRFESGMLNTMLHDELCKEVPEGERVRAILRILEEREKDFPVKINPWLEKECGQFMQEDRGGIRSTKPRRSFVLKAASVFIILGILMAAISQKAEADGFYQRVIRWTDSVFELLGPNQSAESDPYVFQSNHPGLQQVYDACVKLGITDPVVPMWIPEEYVLEQCKTYGTPVKQSVVAEFSFEEERFLFKLDFYSTNSNFEFYKDESIMTEIEINGQAHSIFRNENAWVVVWLREDIECSIYVNCQEDVLHRILRSIYMMGDTE